MTTTISNQNRATLLFDLYFLEAAEPYMHLSFFLICVLHSIRICAQKHHATMHISLRKVENVKQRICRHNSEARQLSPV